MAQTKLSKKEKTALEDLQTQEQACIDKYTKYQSEAKDPVLRDLFAEIAEREQQHFNTLGDMINGKVPECDVNDESGSEYNPEPTYGKDEVSDDKTSDCFLATDAIGTEKLVSSEYNSDVFVFSDSSIRKVLADIQVEEQNHAEMIWKYKTVNGMQ